MLLNTIIKQVLRGLRCQWREAFCVCVHSNVFSGGSKSLQLPISSPSGGRTPSPSQPLLAAPLPTHTQTRAPIDAHHSSSTTERTQGNCLQRHNDDKSHKRCQRHSDSKKHPLKIHPGHIQAGDKLKEKPT